MADSAASSCMGRTCVCVCVCVCLCVCVCVCVCVPLPVFTKAHVKTRPGHPHLSHIYYWYLRMHPP